MNSQMKPVYVNDPNFDELLKTKTAVKNRESLTPVVTAQFLDELMD